MRILDDEANAPINSVWVYLTRREALDLATQLDEYFREEPPDLDWHGHLTSDDGQAKEMTVAIYDPTAPSKPEWHA
jgi:hypothetical protein